MLKQQMKHLLQWYLNLLLFDSISFYFNLSSVIFFQKRHYDGLMELASLERAANALQPLGIAQYSLRMLPEARERIRERSMHALNEWLELVRHRALEVGKRAVDRTARRAERERERLKRGGDISTLAAMDAEDESMFFFSSLFFFFFFFGLLGCFFKIFCIK